MKTTKLLLICLLGITFVLTACGDDDKGQDDQATEESALTLSGRLLYRSGSHLEILDLATRETTVLQDENIIVSSPATLSADQTRAAFVSLTDFGAVDLTTGEFIQIRNTTGGTSTQALISPDGQWVAMQNVGQTYTHIHVAYLGDMLVEPTPQRVRMGRGAAYWIGWTTDSRLVWMDGATPDEWMILEPAVDGSNESVPVGDTPMELLALPPAATSPDGAYLAQIPVSFDATLFSSRGFVSNPGFAETCYDSQVRVYPLPMPPGAAEDQATQLWSESGIVAASPQWLTDDQLLYLKVGPCTSADINPIRDVMLLDTTTASPTPRKVLGPVGNASDDGDFEQLARHYDHLYSPSPDGKYVAWISDGETKYESLIKITEVETGTTETVVHLVKAEDQEVPDFLSRDLIRQVVWLE